MRLGVPSGLGVPDDATPPDARCREGVPMPLPPSLGRKNAPVITNNTMQDTMWLSGTRYGAIHTVKENQSCMSWHDGAHHAGPPMLHR